jgi:cytochrome c-type biogenesis protein CcmH/NrfG
VALSMEEQRILAEIEQRLAKSEPALAARLASFGRPGPANVLRSPRVRVLASCIALVVVTVVSLIAYALLPLRALPDRTGGRATSASRQPTMTVPQAPALQQYGPPPPVLKGQGMPPLTVLR